MSSPNRETYFQHLVLLAVKLITHSRCPSHLVVGMGLEIEAEGKTRVLGGER